jgi:hypothetical protein
MIPLPPLSLELFSVVGGSSEVHKMCFYRCVSETIEAILLISHEQMKYYFFLFTDTVLKVPSASSFANSSLRNLLK